MVVISCRIKHQQNPWNVKVMCYECCVMRRFDEHWSHEVHLIMLCLACVENEKKIFICMNHIVGLTILIHIVNDNFPLEMFYNMNYIFQVAHRQT